MPEENHCPSQRRTRDTGLRRKKPLAGTIERGVNAVKRLAQVDQRAIGRTPRSNLATYTGLFDDVRKLFATTKLARARKYDAGQFHSTLEKDAAAPAKAKAPAITETEMEKRIHVALAVESYQSSLHEYTARLGVEPECTVDDEYALWRTDELNLSIRVVPAAEAGRVLHLGFEDATAPALSQSIDANGILWERFTGAHQRDEIIRTWPTARFRS